MDSTTGQANVIPGISGAGLAMAMASDAEGGKSATGGVQTMALFSNPQRVYNALSGTWNSPPGHMWNGKYWYDPRKMKKKRSPVASTSGGRQSSKVPALKAKRKRETGDSSDDEAAGKPKPRKLKAAVNKLLRERREAVARSIPVAGELDEMVV